MQLIDSHLSTSPTHHKPYFHNDTHENGVVLCPQNSSCIVLVIFIMTLECWVECFGYYGDERRLPRIIQRRLRGTILSTCRLERVERLAYLSSKPSCNVAPLHPFSSKIPYLNKPYHWVCCCCPEFVAVAGCYNVVHNIHDYGTMRCSIWHMFFWVCGGLFQIFFFKNFPQNDRGTVFNYIKTAQVSVMYCLPISVCVCLYVWMRMSHVLCVFPAFD